MKYEFKKEFKEKLCKLFGLNATNFLYEIEPLLYKVTENNNTSYIYNFPEEPYVSIEVTKDDIEQINELKYNSTNIKPGIWYKLNDLDLLEVYNTIGVVDVVVQKGFNNANECDRDERFSSVENCNQSFTAWLCSNGHLRRNSNNLIIDISNDPFSETYYILFLPIDNNRN